MRKFLFAAALAAASLPSPAGANNLPGPHSVTIHESYQGVTDISPPSILNVKMSRKGGHKAARTRCEDMGGHYHKNHRLCMNVDY